MDAYVKDCDEAHEYLRTANHLAVTDMMPKSKMPTRKQSKLKEVETIRKFIFHGSLNSSMSMQAMETVAVCVAEDRLNTPEGREAVYAMRSWYVSLRRM